LYEEFIYKWRGAFRNVLQKKSFSKAYFVALFRELRTQSFRVTAVGKDRAGTGT
jgi:hypothetical protein